MSIAALLVGGGWCFLSSLLRHSLYLQMKLNARCVFLGDELGL